MSERDTGGPDRPDDRPAATPEPIEPAAPMEPAAPTEPIEHAEPAEPAGGATGEAADQQLLDEIDAELAAEKAARPRAGTKLVGAVLLIGALVGWIAALNLTVDKMFLLENPDADLACDINPLISCGNVMMTWQAEALGIPNMAIGLAGFAIMGVLGSLMLAGRDVPRWMRWARLGGMTFAIGHVHFLAYSAIFVIGSLCPWCVAVWAVTAPMFFATLARAIESGDLPFPRPLAGFLRRWMALTLAWYLLMAIVIAVAFLPQWLVMLGVA